MKIHHHRGLRHGSPDLFDWLAERELRASNPAGRKIAEWFGLPIHTAALLALHAGLGGEDSR